MELVERMLVPLVGGVNPGADLKVSGMKVRFAVRYSESLDGTQCVLLIQRFDRKLTAKPVSPHPDRCYCELICGVSSGLLRGYREGPAETGLELHKLGLSNDLGWLSDRPQTHLDATARTSRTADLTSTTAHGFRAS